MISGAGLTQRGGKGGGHFDCREYGHLKRDYPNGSGGRGQDGLHEKKPKYMYIIEGVWRPTRKT